jgi:PEP-CTERM motif
MPETAETTPPASPAYRLGAMALATGASMAWSLSAQGALITQQYGLALGKANDGAPVTIGAGSPFVAGNPTANPPIADLPAGGPQFPDVFSYGIGWGSDTLGFSQSAVVAAFDSNSLPKATELSAGALVGPLSSFITRADTTVGGAYWGDKSTSSIKNSPGSVTYIGLRFFIDGNPNPLYAYATVIGGQGGGALGAEPTIAPVLASITYDNAGAAVTVPSVPEPGSLGLLALGAAGLAGLRRRRRVH